MAGSDIDLNDVAYTNIENATLLGADGFDLTGRERCEHTSSVTPAINHLIGGRRERP